MNRVTLQDVATQVGVDRSTVSRVLSNKAAAGGISDELADKITQVARDLKYIPNSSARAVRTGRFHCAALLMSTHTGRSYLPSRLLDGIHDQLSEADMHLTVAKVPDEKLNSHDYVPKILRTMMADGLLINYTHHLPEHLVELVETCNLPSVWINTDRAKDAVFPNNRAAARLATERLIECGHRRIAYVDLCHDPATASAAHFSVSERPAGYLAAMQHAGLAAQVFRPRQACLAYQDEREAALQFLQQNQRPTALVCYFSIFLPAILWAAAQLKIRVPEDLSIITFAAEDLHEQGVTVTSLVEPHYRMGQEAVRVLNERLERPTARLASRSLDFVWQDMGTCVPPARNSASG